VAGGGAAGALPAARVLTEGERLRLQVALQESPGRNVVGDAVGQVGDDAVPTEERLLAAYSQVAAQVARDRGEDSLGGLQRVQRRAGQWAVHARGTCGNTTDIVRVIVSGGWGYHLGSTQSNSERALPGCFNSILTDQTIRLVISSVSRPILKIVAREQTLK